MMKLFKVLACLAMGLFVLAGAYLALNWEPDRPAKSLMPRWAPLPSRFVELGGMEVHYRDEGRHDDPSPLVLLHGTSSSLHTWEGWVTLLKAQKRVISLDLPGFGLTGPRPDGDYRTETEARFVLQFLDAMHVQKFDVAGNSMGGNVAWRLSLLAPERVQHLVLVDATGQVFTPQSIPLGFRLARTPVLNKLLRDVLPRGVVEASVRNVYGDPVRVKPIVFDREFELTLREGNRDALVQSFEQADHGADVGRIKTIKTPTLIVWGGKDRLIPPENAKLFAAQIAGSKLVMFDDLGHVPQEEDPARTAAAVKAFLGI
jgi:pimeloyl-ACP methyl ester carboxylesterase